VSVIGQCLNKKERVPDGPTLNCSEKPYEVKHRLYNAKAAKKASARAYFPEKEMRSRGKPELCRAVTTPAAAKT
jgi:hypothetical protein